MPPPPHELGGQILHSPPPLSWLKVTEALSTVAVPRTDVSQDDRQVDGDGYGERRYSGGRNGSVSNWPGMGGRPPLVIEAPR